jgi:hypothetical protein
MIGISVTLTMEKNIVLIRNALGSRAIRGIIAPYCSISSARERESDEILRRFS